MNEQPREPSNPPSILMSRASLGALVAGLFMGQVVKGIAAHHQGSAFGLLLALIYIASASTSVVMFLLCSPAAQGRPRSPSVHAWLGAQAAGLLLSLQAGALL